jgi:alkanesulfonate monooxygenase SsuD/methylene tetrahydromethanopterin reductase-like flavin-dependent oxidoreductase (luciferase family)
MMLLPHRGACVENNPPLQEEIRKAVDSISDMAVKIIVLRALWDAAYITLDMKEDFERRGIDFAPRPMVDRMTPDLVSALFDLSDENKH